MNSFSKSSGDVGSESAKHSKHPIALRLFYSLIVFVVGAALLPVIPVAAASVPGPQVSSAPSAYTAVNPTRVMDTRTGSGLVGAGNTLGPGASFSLVVAPNATAGVPATATAVVMNVTATNTTAASYLTVYPTLASLPFASNLNWVAGYTVPNLVTVQPGSGGAVTFYNKFGSVDVVADVAGYFAPPSGSAGGEVGAGFPQRLVDTRAGSGFLGAGSALGPAATANYQVTGKAGVPASGVSAVILNATVTNTSAASFLTLWPQGATKNTVSNANWVAGWTRANRAIVPVSATGQISAYNQFGSVDVILDVDGYFTNASASGALFTSVSPIRLADHTALGPNSSFNQSITGQAGIPAGASAAMLNSTVSETTAPSFLTVYPTGSTRPTTSDINWVAGQVNPNLGVATLGTGGMATFYNSAGNVNVTIDLEGYFGGLTGVVVTANPTSLPANPAGATSKVDVTVYDANGVPIALDPVSFTLTPSVAGACGTGLTSQTTNGAGKIPQQTYTPSAVVGTCLITATEAIGAKTGSVTITQTAPPNTITFAPNNGVTGGTSIPVAANGAVQSFTTTTRNSATLAVIVGDTLTFATSGGASCGTIGNVLPAGGISDGAGQVTFDYTASNTIGFCTITATESGTGATNSVLVTQRAPAGINTSALTATTATTILGNGTDTVALTDTVSGTAGIASDAVIFKTAPSIAGACGTVSPSSGTTNASGVLNTTYTASTTAGTCIVSAFEANGGSSSSITITQNQVPNSVAVSANPASISATTSSTSALTVTVTSGVGGAAVVGDAVSFATASDPGGTCGAITGNSTPTNASGQVTATYTATIVVGFCTITATDTTSGGSGKVRITQTNPASAALVTTVVANPTSVPADGTAAASVVTATVKTSGGTLVSGDHVAWTLSASTAGACPATPASADTVSGQVSFNYNATTTVGTCTITATEANSGSSGSATVTQTAVPNTVTFTTLAVTQAEGGAASAVVAHVAHLGVSVASDLVTFTTSGGASCGVFSPTSATTPANPGSSGDASTAYTPSLTVGFCKVTATDATGALASATITQTTNPAAANSINVTNAALAPSATANGVNTSAITATVTGANIAGDPVRFTLTDVVAGACGTIAPTTGVTSGAGLLTATYTVSTTPGGCIINAVEANGGTTDATPPTVTSTPRPNNIALTTSTTSVSTSGGGTATLTVTVTNANTGVGVNADAITFALTPSGVATTCGTLSPTNGPTNSSGVFTTTYTTGITIGSCSITATEAATAQTSTAIVITQTA